MLTDHDRWLIDRAHLLRTADVCEHTGEPVPALAYVRWAGEAKQLLAELADRLEQVGGS
jgi:hypothetical protein